eukprot:4352430-Prymnesium_polylepis.2
MSRWPGPASGRSCHLDELVRLMPRWGPKQPDGVGVSGEPMGSDATRRTPGMCCATEVRTAVTEVRTELGFMPSSDVMGARV